jgi:hypothetical protein
MITSFTKQFAAFITRNQSIFKPISSKYSFTSSSNPTQVSLLEEIEAKVMQVLRTSAKCNQKILSKTSTFEELGLDSLDTTEIVVSM